MRRRQESGFALLLVFAMAGAIAIMLYMQLPRLAFEAQRDKEQLLIERGEEYIRGVQLFYNKWQRYPQNLDELEKFGGTRYLRKRYRDPMTGKDEWRLLKMNAMGQLENSVIPKKEDKKANTNTFISEAPAMLATNSQTPGTGVNLAMRRRPSEQGGDPGLMNGQGGPQGIGQSVNGQAVTPQLPNNPATAQLDPNAPGTPGYDPNAQNLAGAQPNVPGTPGFNPALPATPAGNLYNPNAPNAVQGQVQPGMPNQANAIYPNGTPGFPGAVQGQMINPATAMIQQQLSQGNLQAMQQGRGQFSQGMPNYPVQQVQPNVSPGGYQPPTAYGQQYQNPQQQYQNQQQQYQNQQQNQNQQQYPGQQPQYQGQQQFPGQQGAGGYPIGAAMQQGRANQNPAAAAIMDSLTKPRQMPGNVPGAAGPMMTAGLAGVASTADADSIKVYNERQKYNEWEFVYDPRKDKRRAGAGQGQAQTMPVNQPGTPLGGSPAGSPHGGSPSGSPFGSQPIGAQPVATPGSQGQNTGGFPPPSGFPNSGGQPFPTTPPPGQVPMPGNGPRFPGPGSNQPGSPQPGYPPPGYQPPGRR